MIGRRLPKPELTADFGQLLLAAARRYNAALLAQLRAGGHPDVTVSRLAMIQLIDPSSSRVIQLAEKAGVSKQAASQTLASLERLGYLERTKGVHGFAPEFLDLTARGQQLLRDMEDVRLRLEQELAFLLGGDRADELLDDLSRYSDRP